MGPALKKSKFSHERVDVVGNEAVIKGFREHQVISNVKFPEAVVRYKPEEYMKDSDDNDASSLDDLEEDDPKILRRWKNLYNLVGNGDSKPHGHGNLPSHFAVY